MTEAAETGMAMHYLYFLPDYDVPKHWEEGEDCRKCCLSIDDEKRDVIHFKAIRKIVNSRTAFIGMSDNDNLVAAVDKLCGQLIDVAFNSSWLRKEKVADHGNVVRHLGREGRLRPTEQQPCNALSWRRNWQSMHDL